MPTLRKVDAETIPVIQQLANITWQDAYRSILPQGQMQYMLQLFYSEASLQQQMLNGHQFIVAEESDAIIAFASYSPKSTEESSVFRLHKIYIDPHQQGKGIGKLLIDFIIADIKSNTVTDLELNVNRHNKALHFYKKLGFKIIKEEDIDIGEGYFMNDYVMNLTL